MTRPRRFPFKGVIFDLDGTLIDSHAAMTVAYEVWAGEYHVDLKELPKYLGMPNSVLAEALLPAEQVAEAVGRIEALEVTGTDGVVALPGARHALTTLPSRRVAIGTSCTRDLLTARALAAGLDVPEIAVTRDQVTAGKPAPETFLVACERLGFAPAEVLVFEDAPAGVQAARAAGCAVIGVTSTRSATELRADAHVASLAEISWHEDATGDWFAELH